jgi:hypothetical protein
VRSDPKWLDQITFSVGSLRSSPTAKEQIVDNGSFVKEPIGFVSCGVGVTGRVVSD